jgi:hypothetical protein
MNQMNRALSTAAHAREFFQMDRAVGLCGPVQSRYLKRQWAMARRRAARAEIRESL